MLGSLVLQDVPLLVSGERATAVVESIEKARRRSRNLIVVFEVKGYPPVRTRIHESMLSNFSVGERVPIAYLRSDPGYAEILTAAQLSTTLLMKILFGGTALGMGLWEVIGGLRSGQRKS